MLKLKNPETTFFLLLMSTTLLLRVPQLGYSHFYGDETKTLYLDKTVPATKFFLDQRKGPLQFFVAWGVEKVSGSYDEQWIRLPFALAGVLSVAIFYILIKKLFNWQTALVSSLLLSFNGLFVAFSRTAQYQSFLILFGFAGLYLYILAVEKNRRSFSVLSSVCMALAFYFHYDAVFFLVPLLYLFWVYRKENITRIKEFLIFFGIPLAVSLALFYGPYVIYGYFQSNTVGYIAKRLSGKEYLVNNSLYTLFVYNPSFLYFIPLVMPILVFFKQMNYRREMLILWFLVPFIAFQFIILNPGTHIQNYLLPLFIMTGALVYEIFTGIKYFWLRYIYLALIALFFTLTFTISANVYLPVLNNGYPWKNSVIKKDYNLFMYGFPYNRGWDQVRRYFLKTEGARGIYTNDNDTIAQYYLRELDYTPPGSNFIPQYYVHIYNNQEFRNVPSSMEPYLADYYTKENEILIDGETMAVIYKRTQFPTK
ncbi:MAG: Glycosyl transferase family 39 [candidate division WWE3 bacterium GW2011_GWB1_41_6]|uniref:Glycosyl transferase family 39 n=1 Tax=candidate division WWE3 bacterium GW2011_GWB1_41_6 TaxID=1619112 RepID=A0A0G0Z1V3_UNCKA|nr:MAG: Glycosyl transferase family 39 [candidate division WWE3 bacterium GW2011_GWB1_41_6]